MKIYNFQEIKNKIPAILNFFKEKWIYFAVFFFILTVITVFYFFQRTTPIHIAVAGPMSGQEKLYGEAMIKGIKLYIDKVNEAGGINDRKIKLRKFNDKTQLLEAMKVAVEIEEDKDILLVLGHYYSSMAIAAGRIYRKSGIPAITASATAESVTYGNDSYFRVITNNRFQGYFIANYIRKTLKRESAIVIHNTDSYGASLAENFKEAAEDAGLKITKTWSFNPESKQLNEDIAKIIAELRSIENPGVLFLATSTTQGVKIISSLKYPDTGYTIIGPDSFSKLNFIENFDLLPQEKSIPGYYSDGVYAVTPFMPEIATKEAFLFREEFKKKYNEEPSWISTCYYDAAVIAVEAVKKIGIEDKTRTQRDRKEIRHYLSKIRTIEDGIKGISGYLYFDQNGDRNRPMAVGVYKKQSLLPAFFQYQVVPGGTPEENLQKTLEGEMMEIDETLMGKTRIVYTGMTINEISELDIINSTYSIDYYLWFRYGGDFNASDIHFINAAEPVSMGKPIIDIKNDEFTLKAFHMKTKFKTDFDFHKYPFDSHILRINFRHAEREKEELIYIVDEMGMPEYLKPELLKTAPEKIELKGITAWRIKEQPYCYQNTLSNASSFGIPEYFNIQNTITYSQFNARIKIERNGLETFWRNFIPIFAMILSLYMVSFIPIERRPISRIWISMSVLIANCIYHVYIQHTLAVEYTTLVEYGIFTIYILLTGVTGISVGIMILLRKNIYDPIRRLIMAGRVIYPVIVVLSILLIINMAR